jgi:hypothetical protein
MCFQDIKSIFFLSIHLQSTILCHMHDFASDLHLYMCKTVGSKKNVEAHYLEQPLTFP